MLLLILQRYEFSSKSQRQSNFLGSFVVVADTTKVRIFKQITTGQYVSTSVRKLLLILQRYEFSSKSQQIDAAEKILTCCCWYYKGTNFQANHNVTDIQLDDTYVVADTTKVRIFKQITTPPCWLFRSSMLLLILQRYEFSSKSQRLLNFNYLVDCCCWYYKGTNFQANHNLYTLTPLIAKVVADTTKVRIFKQITTAK